MFFLNDDKKEKINKFIKSKTNFTDYYKRGSNKMKIIFGKYSRNQIINNTSFFKTRNTVTLKESIKVQEETSSSVKGKSNYFIKVYNDFFNKNLLHFGEFNTNKYILHSIKYNNAIKKINIYYILPNIFVEDENLIYLEGLKINDNEYNILFLKRIIYIKH